MWLQMQDIIDVLRGRSHFSLHSRRGRGLHGPMNTKDFNAQQWGDIIWLDECYIHLNDQSGRVYVTRHANEEYDENCVIPTFKQSSVCVMFWGCIMKGRKGPLVVLEYTGGRGGGMTGQRYISQVLEAHLNSFYHQMKEERP